jgi:two-component system response regulator PilR (NtrC family)
VTHFLQKICGEMSKPVPTVSHEAFALLERYHWPGNIRELENVIERAIVLGGGANLGVEALPADLAITRENSDVPLELPESGLDLEATLERIEQRYIEQALARTGGVQTRAAELLGISFRQFRYKLQKLLRPARHASRSVSPSP